MAIHKLTLFAVIVLVYAAYKSHPVNTDWQSPISFRNPMPYLRWAYKVTRFIVKRATLNDWISVVCVIVGFAMPITTIFCFVKMLFVPALSQKPDLYNPVALMFFFTVIYSGVMIRISKPRMGTSLDLLILIGCALSVFVFFYKFLCSLKAHRLQEAADQQQQQQRAAQKPRKERPRRI